MTDKILDICQRHAPRKKPFTGKPKKLHGLRRRRKRLEKRLSKAKHLNSITRLERDLALVHYEIREAICNYKDKEEDTVISKIKSNPKVFYSFAKSHSVIRNDISSMRDNAGIITQNPEKIANILQEQFSSVYSEPYSEYKKDPDFPILTENSLSPEAFKISETDIVSATSELNPNSSPGPDGVPAKLLIKCSHALSVPLTIMWRESFDSNVVPNFYKSTAVCPVHKKEDRTSPANYRPISLTSHIMKTAERVV